MAFDLNKNDGSAQDSSKKTPATSKFNLSKKEVEEIVVAESSSKSKTWIIGLIGVLIVGGGIWYYSSKTKLTDNVKSASTEVIPTDPAVAIVPLAQVKAQPAVVDTTVHTGATSQSAQVVENTSAVSAKVAASHTLITSDAAVLNHKIPATFGLGSSSFISVDQSLINRIISYLAKNPDTSINVNGYASSDGSLEINQTISQARADAFKKYLVSKNIAESRIIASGKGIENPVASNHSNAGRKKNRRVEITLP
jgi:outer membrane protein OmpA-like peptidoglycan-associated protein